MFHFLKKGFGLEINRNNVMLLSAINMNLYLVCTLKYLCTLFKFFMPYDLYEDSYLFLISKESCILFYSVWSCQDESHDVTNIH